MKIHLSLRLLLWWPLCGCYSLICHSRSWIANAMEAGQESFCVFIAAKGSADVRVDSSAAAISRSRWAYYKWDTGQPLPAWLTLTDGFKSLSRLLDVHGLKPCLQQYTGRFLGVAIVTRPNLRYLHLLSASTLPPEVGISSDPTPQHLFNHPSTLVAKLIG